MSSPSSSIQKTDPNVYAYNLCNAIMQESGECQRGVNFAAQKLTDSSIDPRTIASMCTASQNNPNVSDSDAFRYGCYMSVVFNDPKKQFCGANVTNVSPDGTPVTVPYPCYQSCTTLLSSSSDIKACQDAVCTMLNPEYAGGPGMCQPDYSNLDSLSQVQTYNDPPYSCASVNSSTPSLIGCTVAGLQAEVLGRVQQYSVNSNQNSSS
jgi:hypothetical protein